MHPVYIIYIGQSYYKYFVTLVILIDSLLWSPIIMSIWFSNNIFCNWLLLVCVVIAILGFWFSLTCLILIVILTTLNKLDHIVHIHNDINHACSVITITACVRKFNVELKNKLASTFHFCHRPIIWIPFAWFHMLDSLCYHGMQLKAVCILKAR